MEEGLVIGIREAKPNEDTHMRKDNALIIKCLDRVSLREFSRMNLKE